MRCRPIDQNGDMLPVISLSEMTEGADAVAQAIQSRFGMLYGEWWENEMLGFQVPAFLMEGLRQNNADMLAKYVVAYVLRTKEVTSLAYEQHEIHGRDMSLRVAVNTQNGEITERSVTMNELLAAVS